MKTNVQYTFREYYEMLRCYTICRGNCAAARRMYIEESMPRLRKNGISDPQIPTTRTFTDVPLRLQEYGSFVTPASMRENGRGSTISFSKEERIRDFMVRNPSTSAREAARIFGVSTTKTNAVGKSLGRVGLPTDEDTLENSLKPVRDPEEQDLKPEDAEPRQAVARWLLENVQENILWTSEVLFTRVALYTVHSQQWRLYNNPRDIQKKGQFSLNVWGGIYKDTIIGPIFIDERLMNGTYTDLLKAVIDEDVEDYLPLAIWKNRDFYFMHNGTPIHYVASMKEYLDARYGQKWIGCDGPVQWPARSPDLSPCDYFLWEEIQERVYDEEITRESDLKYRIMDAFEELRGEDFNLVMQRLEGNVYKRALLCLEYKGREFENFIQYAD